MKRWSVYFTIITLLIAIFTLAGWLLDIELLKSPLPNTIAMNPMSAVGIILLGISLITILNSNLHKTLMIVVLYLLTFATILIGVLQLSYLYLNSTFAIDQLLFSEKLEASFLAGISSHIAPSTACCFIIASTALLTIRNKPLYAQWSSIVVGLIATFSIVSYIYRVPEFYYTLSFLPMSIQTAVCLYFLSLALLFAYSNTGLMPHFVSTHTGSRFAQILIPAAIIIPFTLGYIRLLLYWREAFSTEFGVAILMLSITIFFLIVIWLVTIKLNKKRSTTR